MAVEQFVYKTLELLQEEREAEIEESRFVAYCANVLVHLTCLELQMSIILSPKNMAGKHISTGSSK